MAWWPGVGLGWAVFWLLGGAAGFTVAPRGGNLILITRQILVWGAQPFISMPSAGDAAPEMMSTEIMRKRILR